MKRILYRSGLLLALLILAGCAADQSPVYENPLAGVPPEGAEARLGWGAISGMAVAPDGETVVFATRCALLFYSIDPLALVRIDPLDFVPLSIDWSADGLTLALGREDGRVILWNVDTGTPIGEIDTRTRLVNRVAFSPTGDRLLTGSEGGQVIVWDAAGAAVQSFSTDEYRVGVLAWSFGGTLIAAAGETGVSVWNALTGDLIATRQFPDTVHDLAFIDDGDLIAVAYGYLDTGEGRPPGGLAIWNVPADSVTMVERGALAPWSVDWQPGGDRLASGWGGTTPVLVEADGTILDAFSDQPETPFDELVEVAWIDERTLLTRSQHGVIGVWNTRRERLIDSATITGHIDVVSGVDWSADGTQIASAGLDGRVIVWDAKTGEEVLRLVDADHNRALDVAISDDGVWLAAAWGSQQGEEIEGQAIGIYDLEDGRQVVRIDGGVFAWAAGGDQLVVADENRAAIWSFAGDRVIDLAVLNDSINRLAWSGDGRWIGGAAGAEIIVWDAASGDVAYRLVHPSGEVSDLDFSPDGEMLAAVAYGGRLARWELSGGMVNDWTDPPVDYFNALVFSPAGDRLAAGIGFHAGAGLLYDAATGEQIGLYADQNGPVLDLDFSPDGTRIAVGSTGGTVVVWGVEQDSSTDYTDITDFWSG
ncbi:MAG: hypothetical protein JXJ17_06285 [Anaerolineae bacterium]|nr:hypothetical protein [Anaerolineae bacterium]